MTLRGSFSGHGAERTTIVPNEPPNPPLKKKKERETNERNVAARFAANSGLSCDTTGTAPLGREQRRREKAEGTGGRFSRSVCLASSGRRPTWPLPTVTGEQADGRAAGGGGAYTLDLGKPTNPERAGGAVWGGRSSGERRDELWRWIKAAPPQEPVSFERPGGDLGTGRASPPSRAHLPVSEMVSALSEVLRVWSSGNLARAGGGRRNTTARHKRKTDGLQNFFCRLREKFHFNIFFKALEFLFIYATF